MPDYTVSSDIDNLLRSTDNADARTNLGAAAASHTHGTGDITGLDAAISANTDVAANTLKETNVDTNLGYTASATNGVVTSSDGTDATIPLADGTNAGLLTPSDFTKLGAIEDNADVTDSTNVVSALDSATLTDAGAPAATDQVLIKDASTGALQTADFSDFGGGAVDSVNSQTGIVVLDADDIDDSTTLHKFATAAQLANADSALQAADIDTLAELNAIITDANLDDASAARTPTAHTHTLSELTQSGATDGQIVAWNNTAGEWQPIDNTGGAASPATAETSIYVDAAAMFAESAGATAETVEGTNNASDVWHVATGETLYAKMAMPPQWDGSDLEVDFVWGSSTGTATENVRWGIAAQCAGDDDAWDTAFSAATQTADDAIINNTDLHLVGVTGVTPSGSPADGDILFLKITRETAGATVSSDDAQLFGLRVKYQNKLVQNWYITKMGNEADDATGTGEKTAWVAPANGKINAVHSGCSTATAGASLTVDVQKNALTILTTKGVIASGDDSTTTGTAHVLTSSPVSFLAGDRISFHIDTFGGTGAKGLHTDLLISWD